MQKSTVPSTDYQGPARHREIQGLRVHVSGDGPPLLALHGFGAGAESLSQFAEADGNGSQRLAFSEHRQVVAVDLPGFGGSIEVSPGDTYYPEFSAALLVEVLDELSIEQVDVVGTSLGGWVGLQMALLFPERLRRLVFVGAGGLLSEDLSGSPSEGLRRLTEFVSRPSPGGMLHWLETQVSDPGLLTDRMVDSALERAMAPGAIAALRSVMRNFSAHGDRVSLWAHAHRVSHQALAVWGRDDRVLPLEGALYGLRRMPRADMHVFSGCGQWVQLERPREFRVLVESFLAG